MRKSKRSNVRLKGTRKYKDWGLNYGEIST